MNDSASEWEEFLDPELLRGKLISASIYLAAFELLTDSIIGRIGTFFTEGFDVNGPIISSEYKAEVLSRNRSRLHASLSWLREQDAIDDNDLKAFEVIKKCRNTVAHELPQIIGGNAQADYLAQFPIMIALLKKIEVWWIINFEVPINPDLDDADIDEAGIMPGPVITLQVMLDIALGSPEEASRYFNEFKKLSDKL